MIRSIAFFALLFFAQKAVGQTASSLEKTVRDFAETNRFSGSVLIKKGEKTLFDGHFGLADHTFSIPVSEKTRFKIASITKTFTAVLIFKMVEKGQVSLDDLAAKHLVDWSSGGREKITIRHLLTHSSGLENFESRGLEVYEMPLPADSLLKKYASGKLVARPGDEFDYNNGEYILLGKIIENVSKKPLAEVFETELFKPLGLQNTGFLSHERIVENRAATYLFDEKTGQFSHDAPFYIENYGSAGSLFSTSKEVAAFFDSLFDLKIISQKSLDEMTRPNPVFWGHAMSVWASDQEIGGKTVRVVERFGSIQGANGLAAVVPSLDWTVVILSNTNATDLGKFKAAIFGAF